MTDSELEERYRVIWIVFKYKCQNMGISKPTIDTFRFWLTHNPKHIVDGLTLDETSDIVWEKYGRQLYGL